MPESVWHMPDWMKPFENFITNTGGQSVENHMNNKAKKTGMTPYVHSQVILLENLHFAGLLKEPHDD